MTTMRLPSLLLGVFIALIGLLGSSRAQDGDVGGDGTTGNQPLGPFAADEAIGTLPTYWSEDEYVFFYGLNSGAFNALQKGQSFEAYVPKDQIQQLFQTATGQGFALIKPVDEQIVRVRIFGSVVLTLDSAALCNVEVQTRIHFGIDYLFGSAQLSKMGQTTNPFALIGTGGHVDLGLAQMVKNKFYGTSVTCMAWAPQGKQALSRAELAGGAFQYRQLQN